MSTPFTRHRVVLTLLAAELAEASETAALACRASASRPQDLRWHLHTVRAMAEMQELREIYAAVCAAPVGEA